MKKTVFISFICYLLVGNVLGQINSKPYKDCVTSYLLSSKEKIVVTENGGAGENTTEVQNLLCFSVGTSAPVEINSFWFKMSCVTSGSLAFTITPVTPINADIDFAVFESSVDDCSVKSLIRCVAAGDALPSSP